MQTCCRHADLQQLARPAAPCCALLGPALLACDATLLGATLPASLIPALPCPAPRQPSRAGRLWLLGRAKDMIKSGGENVHAWEVERCLADHPAVAMAAVVGAADWRLGEAVAAAVVLRPGWRWSGARCQVLLAPHGQAAGRAAANSVLAAAAAAVAPPGGSSGSLAAGGSSGAGAAGGTQRAEERRQAAGLEEDWRRTLLQGSASRPGSSLETSSSMDGSLLAAEAALWEQQGRQRQPGALQQLAAVAAGLQAAADRSGPGSSGGPGGSSGTAADRGNSVGPGGRCVDGLLLQQHCRAAGLAGFKLPRVFLLCDAAGAVPAGGGGLAGGREVLPLNSTGKVVKHLLRQRIQQHMQAASRAGGSSGGGGGGSGPCSRL